MIAENLTMDDYDHVISLDHDKCALEVRVRYYYCGRPCLTIFNATSFKDCVDQVNAFIEESAIPWSRVYSANIYDGRRRCASITRTGHINLL